MANEDLPEFDDPLPPVCEMCGSLERMRPAGTPDRPYWECHVCGAVSIA